MGDWRGLTLRRLPPDTPQPCRYCGRDAWMADDVGPTHACCKMWAVLTPDAPCLACAHRVMKPRGRGRA